MNPFFMILLFLLAGNAVASPDDFEKMMNEYKNKTNAVVLEMHPYGSQTEKTAINEKRKEICKTGCDQTTLISHSPPSYTILLVPRNDDQVWLRGGTKEEGTVSSWSLDKMRTLHIYGRR